jgi:hypothetical protein
VTREREKHVSEFVRDDQAERIAETHAIVAGVVRDPAGEDIHAPRIAARLPENVVPGVHAFDETPGHVVTEQDHVHHEMSATIDIPAVSGPSDVDPGQRIKMRQFELRA